MDITVSVKIEMDASASLSQMERQIQEAGREAMKEGLKRAIRHKEEQQAGCSNWQGPCSSSACCRKGFFRMHCTG